MLLWKHEQGISFIKTSFVREHVYGEEEECQTFQKSGIRQFEI